MRPSRTGEALIVDLAEALDIPTERYEDADRSYKSVCSWLERPESRFAKVSINAYTQGSFRLGTVIRPASGGDHFDLDIVFEFSISKLHCTQKQIHDDLGHELNQYASRYGMEPPSPWRRCWTLDYHDKAQFHMDVLPSVPDGQRQRRLREARSLSLAFVDQSISITDSDHENYRRISDDWPASNPNGYAEWFYERMKAAFELKRTAMMLAEAKADISEIPAFRVKTPLQAAIQILKHHRDIRFADAPEDRPSSIVITTLAAHAYNQEATVSGALFSILRRMDEFIEHRGRELWIENPSDPRENFADFWNEEPKRKEAFDDWLETARTDFAWAAQQDNPSDFIEALAPRMGRRLVEAAVAKSHKLSGGMGSLARRASQALARILDAPHRRPLAWPRIQTGVVRITSALSERRGFRPAAFSNDGPPVPMGSTLRFIAETNVVKPYKVFWQIVNTGAAAAAARNLRGSFEEVSVTAGTLTKTETATYPGSHSIECFIIKDGYCVARSDPFVVNIS